MRVTVEEKTEELLIRVEGRLIEPWTAELQSTWTRLPLRSERVCLDISGLLFADKTGKRILTEIVEKTQCEVRANSPFTQDLADEITGAQPDPNRSH